MAKPTRGQKAAKTLGKKHFAKIGAKGGTKTPGTFKTLPGFATRAGKISGLSRRLKMLERHHAAAGADNDIEAVTRLNAEIAQTKRDLEAARA